MIYKITITTDVEHQPGNTSHWMALLKNPNNKFDVIGVEKLDI